MTEDDLKSISDFDKYEQFIKTFIVSNLTLWKLIFYPHSFPLTDERATDPEDPYQIFTRDVETDKEGKSLYSHGVVLFQDKDDTILNSTNVIVLVSYESTRRGNSRLLDNNYIIFQIICKGNDIRKLANGKDRVEAIEELIDNEFNYSKPNNISDIMKISCDKLSLNEQNIGRVLTYKCVNYSSNWGSNKNFKKRILGEAYDN